MFFIFFSRYEEPFLIRAFNFIFSITTMCGTIFGPLYSDEFALSLFPNDKLFTNSQLFLGFLLRIFLLHLYYFIIKEINKKTIIIWNSSFQYINIIVFMVNWHDWGVMEKMICQSSNIWRIKSQDFYDRIELIKSSYLETMV